MVDHATNPADGVRIAYRTFGDSGPVVVLVHGTALSQVIWRGFGYVRDLAADHRVITLDLRGHGRSDKPHDDAAYTSDRFVEDVLAVLTAEHVDRAHYVGYSLGGRVGFSLADTHPERVGRFVSVAGAPGVDPGAFDRVFFPGCTRAVERGGMSGFLAEWERHAGAPLDRATRIAFEANDPEALAAYLRETEKDEGVGAERLATWTTPTLMLVGDGDEERLRSARSVVEHAPTAELVVVPGRGHGDVLRDPATVTAVRAFLSGRPRA